MLERQFADFLFNQLAVKIPALRNDENSVQVKEIETLIEQLKNIVDVSLTELPKQVKKKTKKEES